MGQALRLASNFVVLNDTFDAEVVEATADIYERLDREFGNFSGSLLIASHAFDDDWPTWEMHPAGDEFVILVSGDVDLVMARGPGHDTTRMTEPGTFVIVPRGTWHTARIRRRSILLFVTPGEGTRNRPDPAQDGA